MKALVFVLLGSVGPSIVAAQQSAWELRAAMPTARTAAAAATLNGQIYVVGGQNTEGRVLDVVERYDPDADTWETALPPLQTARTHAAAVAFRGRIFVLGGRDEEGNVLDEVEVFDPAENRWRSEEHLDEGREGLAAFVLYDVAYALGGSNKDGYVLDSVEWYDAQEEDWKRVETWKLDLPRVALETAVIGHDVFIVGGINPPLGPVRFIERYRFGEGTTQLSEVPPPLRGNVAATAVEDRIFVVGGRLAAGGATDVVDVFIPERNAWDVESRLRTAREGAVAVTVENTVYAVGGLDAQGRALHSVEALGPINVAADAPPAPPDFALESNYPNPFSEYTRLTFQVSSQADRAPVRLTIYDLQGRTVKTLVNEQLSPGRHQTVWHGTDQERQPVGSGVYLCRLRQGPYVKERPLVLIR